MRILAIADEPSPRLWGDLCREALRDVDLILSAGDLPSKYLSFLTCFSNYGPGSGITGPSGNFDAIPNAAKWLLSFDMLVGRLEIFTILLLFTPSFWRAK